MNSASRRARRSLRESLVWFCQGVRFKLLLGVLIAAILPTALVVPFQIQRVESRLEGQASEMLVQVAGVQQRRINHELRRLEIQAELIALRTQLRASLAQFNRDGSAEALDFINRALADNLERPGDLKSLWIYGSDGRPVAGDGISAERIPDPLRHLPEISRDQFVIQGFWAPGTLNCEPGLWMSAPMFSDGQPIGLVVAEVSLDGLQALLMDFPRPELIGESFVVIHREGDPSDCAVISGQTLSLIGVGEFLLSDEEYEAELATLPDGELITIKRPGQSILVIAQPLDYGLGRLYASSSQSQIADLRNEILGGTGISIGLVLGLALLISLWVSKRIAQPFSRLEQAVRQLQSGKEIAPIDSHGWSRELRTLAEAVNHSSDQIARNIAALRREIGRRRSVQAELRTLANTDELTGLANRRQFLKEIEQTLRRLRQRPSTAALVYLDLDGFKPINDQYGHDVGDEVLKTVAVRIVHALREEDLAARLGGDEFAVLLDYGDEDPDLQALTDRLEFSISQTMVVEGHSVRVGCSIGRIRLSSKMDVHTALKQADEAMYRVKSSRKTKGSRSGLRS